MDTQHPIDPAVRAQVLEQLAQIERRENVRILYACESGSRGWGFASSDSDYDVRFIFVRPLSQYLRLYPPRDVIEVAPGPVFDVNGWDLKKALLLLAKGNATVLEWLSSPIVYRAEGGFLAQMHAAAVSVHRPQRLFHHYAAMARGSYRECLQGEMVRAKKYLYVLRPVLAALWVTQRQDAPPMAFESLVEAMVTDPAVKADIAELLVMKRAALEQTYFPRRAVLNRFLEETFDRLDELGMPAAGEVDVSVLESVFLAYVKASEVLRDGAAWAQAPARAAGGSGADGARGSAATWIGSEMTTPEPHDKLRNVRLETRVSSDQKDLFQRVARLTGRTLSEFVIDSALQAATKIVHEHEVIRLSRADQVAFATALLNPPKPGKRLQRAVREYRRLLAPSAIDVVLQGTEWNSAAEIGHRLDAKAANLHAAVSRWQHSGRIFGIDHRGKKIYPAYIFDATWQPLPAVKKILAVLDDYSPFRVAAWFESTNSFLGGRRPREVIASAPQAVVAAAQDHKVGAVHG